MNLIKLITTTFVFVGGVMEACGQLTQTNTFSNVNLSVPDGNTAGVQDIRSVSSEINQITSVRVFLKIAGQFNGDLYVYLRHNNGSSTHISVLLNRPGRTTSNIYGYADSGLDVTFDDTAANDIHTYENETNPPANTPLYGTWQPDARFVDPAIVTSDFPRSAFLNVFDGMDASGEWTLFVADVSPGGTNFLDSWGLELTGTVSPSITWSNPADIIYGAALGPGQLNATANVPGTFAYNPPAGTVLAAGNNQPLSVTFLPDDTNTYAVESAGVSLNVLPQPLTVSADNQFRTYGALNPPLTGTLTGVQNGDNLSASFSTTADVNSPVGAYPVTPTLQDPDGKLANYNVSYVNGSLNVGPAVLSVTADDQTRPYGVTNPVFTASFSGFVNGESLTNSDVGGTPLLGTLADTSSPVGVYDITNSLGSLTSTNYTFSFTNGTLTVSPAAITVTADDQSRSYGAANPALTASYTGFANGDTAAVISGSPLLSVSADTSSPVGSYAISVTNGTLSVTTNYSFTFVNGSLTVTQAGLTVSADNQFRTYGALNPPLTGTLTGVQNGDNLSASFSTTADVNSPVGAYPVTPTLQDPDGKLANYNAIITNGILTITEAVSIPELVSSANPSLSGSSVTFTVNLTTSAPSSGTPSGTVQFMVDGTNYEEPVTLAGGSASITTAALPVGEHAISAEYAGDGNFQGTTAALDPAQVINSPPVAGTNVIYRIPTQGAKVPVSVLLENDSDSDGDAVVFDTVNPTSTAGGTLIQSNGWVFYTPPTGFTNDDSFTYIVSDGFGAFATGTVEVNVLTNRGTAAKLTLLNLGNGTFQVRVAGVPLGNYTVEFTESLSNQNWVVVATGTSDFDGNFVVDDSPPNGTPARFYRAIFEGDGTLSMPFSFTLTSSANPASTNLPVTFTANLTTPAPNSSTPSGTVQFMVDDANYGDPVTLAGGGAILTTASLPRGEHAVSAVYSGNEYLRSATCVLGLPQLIDTPPAAEESVIFSDPIEGTKFPLSELNFSDADGDPLIPQNISSTTAEGGTITVTEGWVFYTPPSGFVGADSFTYTLQDIFGLTATATVQTVPSVGSGDPSANLTIVNLGGGTYRIVFSGIPWQIYTIQYTESLEQPNWQSITNMTADSEGVFEYDDTLPQGTQSRYYRSVSQSLTVTASPFRLAVWTNFIAHTNGQTMDMWSERIYPANWPNSPPLLAWNTNCLLYGLDGFTGISQCNEFEGAPGQGPITLLTRRHGYYRGHSAGTNGLRTDIAGQRVWFCAADNTVVQMTIAAVLVRLESDATNTYDYSIMIFTEDVPTNINPVSVISPVNMEIFYYNTPDIPYMFFATEQLGHCAAGVAPFIYDTIKGGDSGSPNMIPSPDNKLIMFSGTSTTGFSPQVQADIDTLSVYEGLNPTNYQLRWYDLSPWEP
jgi:subtilisin-like proprotein convertase family protein